MKEDILFFNGKPITISELIENGNFDTTIVANSAAGHEWIKNIPNYTLEEIKNQPTTENE